MPSSPRDFTEQRSADAWASRLGKPPYPRPRNAPTASGRSVSVCPWVLPSDMERPASGLSPQIDVLGAAPSYLLQYEHTIEALPLGRQDRDDVGAVLEGLGAEVMDP